MAENILKQVKLITKTYDILPSRSKGQNFLVDREVLSEIVEAAQLKQSDTVLEVGPGLGILTEELIRQAGKVVSVELDKKLYNFLQTKFSGVKNLKLINEDILKFNPQNFKLSDLNYKIVANIPYNITSHFLKKFLTAETKPSDMTLLIQKEVAQRVCAQPGQMSLLSISVQLYSQPKIMEFVSKKSFWPSPEVDSAVLKLSSIKSSDEVDNFLQGISEKSFWQLVKIGFSAKRKQLQNNLSAGLKIPSAEVKKILKQANFNPQVRAQNLSLTDWIKLAKKIK